MRIASFIKDGRAGYGLVRSDRLFPASEALTAHWPSVRDLLSAERYGALLEADAGAGSGIALDTVQMLPPIPNPEKIICVGLNYRTHIRESGREAPTHPLLFTRFPATLVGHGEAMLRPSISEQFDFEGELAVVIGRTARRVAAVDAFQYIAGYSCMNEGSIRDFQRHTIQFTAGKNFWRSGSFGPWLVTADEIADPEQLRLVTRLNGAVMQDAMTSDLLFGIAALIEYLSAILPLEPGDVIATGTTGGVGAARTPPVWMKPGDLVEVEISGIGILANPIGQDA